MTSYLTLKDEQELERYLDEVKDKVDWGFVVREWKLTPRLIDKYSKYFNHIIWVYISAFHPLTEDLLRKYKNKVNWIYVCSKQKLSPQIIEELKDKVVWELIGTHQELPEDFISKYKDKLFPYVFSSQRLSSEFIIRHIRDIDQKCLEHLLSNRKIKLSSVAALLLTSKFPKYKTKILRKMNKKGGKIV